MRRRGWVALALVAAGAVGSGYVVRRNDATRKPEWSPPATATDLIGQEVSASGTAITSRSGSPFRLPPVGTPPAQTLAQLRPLAPRSPQATCRVAVELFRCRVADAALEMVMKYRDLMPASRRAPMDARLDAINRDTAGCSEVSVTDLDQVLDWQLRAMRTGSPQVQRWALEHMLPRHLDPRPFDARKPFERQMANEFARRALERREVEDIPRLVPLYGPPGFDETSGALGPDPVMTSALVHLARRYGVQLDGAAAAYLRNVPRTRELDAAVSARMRELTAHPWHGRWWPPDPRNQPDSIDGLWGIKPDDCAFP